MNAHEKKKPIPAWVWIGCGCLLFPILVMLLVSGLGFAGFQFAKGKFDTMSDPVKRDAAVLEILGTEALPQGFHVRSYLPIPFTFDVVVLGDGVPPEVVTGDTFEAKADSFAKGLILEPAELGRQTLIFVALKRDSQQSVAEIFRRYRGGGNTGNEIQFDLGVDFEVRDQLDSGELEIKGDRIAWSAYGGAMVGDRSTLEGIITELEWQCAERRIGLLVTKSTDEAPLFDPIELELLLSGLDVCR